MVSKGEMKSELKQDDSLRGFISGDHALSFAHVRIVVNNNLHGRYTVSKAGNLIRFPGVYFRKNRRGLYGNFSGMPDMSK